MADALEKFTHNRAGYRAVMRSAGVRNMLLGKAEAVRAAAERDVPADVYLLADTTVGTNRAGATVIGVPMRLERERRVLGSAIDAAR
jgi:hypothetical protein